MQLFSAILLTFLGGILAYILASFLHKSVLQRVAKSLVIVFTASILPTWMITHSLPAFISKEIAANIFDKGLTSISGTASFFIAGLAIFFAFYMSYKDKSEFQIYTIELIEDASICLYLNLFALAAAFLEYYIAILAYITIPSFLISFFIFSYLSSLIASFTLVFKILRRFKNEISKTIASKL
ncbi:hypothetical protein [Anaerospora hongkongensis]|uniref:hypothetical protein n=1 Tax=Anaerospora hongkongensis TaxID=244830 RepID=UPI002896E4A6|nr:hypothetical protein [Anaerospora hongkongensis]